VSYQTSKFFGNIKKHKEADGNLTSSQYLEKLDYHIDAALAAIVANTSYLESAVAGLLGWQELNYRRRVSLHGKAEFIEKAITWLIIGKTDRIAKVKELRLDRGVALALCSNLLKECASYGIASRKSTLTNEDARVVYNTELQIGSQSLHSNLFETLLTVDYNLKKALEAKSVVLSKFYRLAIMAAKRDYTGYFNCRVNLDDLCGEYIMASSRAIDKCDYEKGPLATYVLQWFLTTRTVCAKRYDFTKEDSLENSILSGMSDPEESLLQTKENSRVAMSIRLLAKIADPVGDARKALGIEEVLSVSEKRAIGVIC